PSATSTRFCQSTASTPSPSAPDLRSDLDVDGTLRQSEVLDEPASADLSARASQHKQAAPLVDSVEQAQRWIPAGVQLIAFSPDTAVLGTYAAAVCCLRHPTWSQPDQTAPASA